MRFTNYYITHLILLFSVVLLATEVKGDKIAHIKAGDNETSLSKNLEILECKANSPSFVEIISKPQPFVKHTKEDVPNFGFTNKNYWIKFTVKNEEEDQRLFLEYAYPFLNKLDVYIPDSIGIYQHKIVGDHFNFDKREIKHKNFLFDIYFKKNETKTIYAHIECDGEATSLPVNFIKPIRLTQKNYEEQTFLGVYYGILLFALFLSIFLAFSLQETVNYQYFFYIIGIGLFQLSLDGLSFEYLWPNNPWLANHIIPLSGSFAIYFLISFTKSLLNTKQHTPKLHKLLTALSILDGFLFVCALFGNPLYSVCLMMLNLVAIISNITIYIVAFIMLRKGFKPARYFFLAFKLLIVGTLTVMLKNFGILPRVFLTEYGIQIGSAIEIIFFTFAISERVKGLKDEKQEIQNRLFKQLQENNQLQIEQNIELERKVKERTLEIQQQSQIIFEKNKDITDSINYAKRIQDAMLSNSEALHLNDDNFFIFYCPRDIVSGDFYWYTQYNDTLILAAVDCTGHGVPGSLMSMIGSTLLNSIVIDMKITQPSMILRLMDESVQVALKQRVDLVSNKDGMDIAICSIDLLQNKLHFSGAQRPLYHANKNGIHFYKGNTNSIGGYFEDQKKYFDDVIIEYEKGDTLYLTSDGYADQFGGPNNKKFMTKNFKQLLSEIQSLPLPLQNKNIEKEFLNWKGENQQVDDILVMGLKL
jgi:serine phosphatase RsbU (regulator of sigma subunit)